MEILVACFGAIIFLLYRLEKKLSMIYDQLPNLANKDKETRTKEISKIDNETYNKNKNYTDRLSEWVKKNENKKSVICHAECKGNFPSISCDFEQNNNKDYNITFTGTMESYYGHLPCMDPVCDFSFIIHFRNNLQDIDIKKKNAKFPFVNIMASQDTYRDNIDDIHYYDGKHTITLELYEDISEFDKYKPLLLSGKTLGLYTSLRIDVTKIKMDDNMIEGKYTENSIGKLSFYQIFIAE